MKIQLLQVPDSLGAKLVVGIELTRSNLVNLLGQLDTQQRASIKQSGEVTVIIQPVED